MGLLHVCGTHTALSQGGVFGCARDYQERSVEDHDMHYGFLTFSSAVCCLLGILMIGLADRNFIALALRVSIDKYYFLCTSLFSVWFYIPFSLRLDIMILLYSSLASY